MGKTPNTTDAQQSNTKGHWLDLPLRLVSDVKPGEGVQAMALLVSIFTLLFSYYVLKTVREPLILATGGADMKSYGAAFQAGVLLLFVPLYSWFASKVDRFKLILGLSAFFVVCLELFYVGAQLGVPNLGFVFYVWVGIFSVSAIAQFWSFANDIYTKEAGERLFAVIGVGATLGGAFGSSLAKSLFGWGLDAYTMLHVAAGLLVVHAGLMVWTHHVHARQVLTDGTSAAQGAKAADPEPLWTAAAQGFGLILKSRYLMLIALVLFLLNWVNTNGEWLLSDAVDRAVLSDLRALSPDLDDKALRALPAFKSQVGQFWGGFFEWVNYLTLAFQALLVSRLVKYGGLRAAVLMLPLVALGAYGAMTIGVGLGLLRILKMLENATDYSVMNTAKAMLWLPTTPAEKYRAKQAADTFFVRLGDVMSFVVITQLSIKGWTLALLNLALVVGWLVASVWLLRSQAAYTSKSPQALK